MDGLRRSVSEGTQHVVISDLDKIARTASDGSKRLQFSEETEIFIRSQSEKTPTVPIEQTSAKIVRRSVSEGAVPVSSPDRYAGLRKKTKLIAKRRVSFPNNHYEISVTLQAKIDSQKRTLIKSAPSPSQTSDQRLPSS